MSERIKVSFNGGKVYDVELGKALQAMANITDKFANEVDALQAENAELREALEEAIDQIDSWGSYASPYFQEKHRLTDQIFKLRAILDKYDSTT